MFAAENAPDIITYASWFAGVVGFALGLYNFIKGRREFARATRDQLTGVMNKLSELDVERDKFEYENATRISDHHVGQMLRKYDHRNWYLARQVTYLMDLIPNQVTDIEYAAVAIALDQHNDREEAMKYWGMAIRKAGGGSDRFLHMKGLARHHFTYGDYNSGRDKYTEALGLASGGGDAMHYVRGELYRSWARSEAEVATTEQEAKRAGDLYRKAKAEYELVRSPRLRRRGLEWLEGVREKFITPQSLTLSGGQPLGVGVNSGTSPSGTPVQSVSD